MSDGRVDVLVFMAFRWVGLSLCLENDGIALAKPRVPLQTGNNADWTTTT